LPDVTKSELGLIQTFWLDIIQLCRHWARR